DGPALVADQFLDVWPKKRSDHVLHLDANACERLDSLAKLEGLPHLHGPKEIGNRFVELRRAFFLRPSVRVREAPAAIFKNSTPSTITSSDGHWRDEAQMDQRSEC